MEELEARIAALEERVFGISYPRAQAVVKRIADQVTSMTQDQAIELLGMGDPEYERAVKLIREVKRYVGKAEG
ncbi:MAG: hypothetical protein DRN68_07915 [Thaumarchaeota archaeon]|nr:MAG: hypothetical protein DRN68_07915 [Nitrososphaerota archaeon]